MKRLAPLAMAFALLGPATAPVLAQSKSQSGASQSVTHVRVFEGPS
jgi:hypothetical protein